jgi:hypothetical protein
MRSLLAPALLALVLAGCGAAPRDSSEQFSGEEKNVAAAVERLETAGRDGDATTVCSKLLGTKLLSALEKQGTNCRTGVKEAFEDADTYDLTVDDVAFVGNGATTKVKYRSRSKEKTATLVLDKERGAWKISSLGTLGSSK